MKFFSFLALAIAVEATTVFQSNEISYYSPDLVVTSLEFDQHLSSISAPKPITYLSFPNTTVTANTLKSTISNFLLTDDVFSVSFFETLVFARPTELSSDAKSYLLELGCVTVYHVPSVPLMPGPYLLHPSRSITKVYRLYWDYNFAFMESVTDGLNGTHIPVTGIALTDAYSALSVAVPSRLYYPPPSSGKPLSGKRLAVKDLYDLKGLRTSGGSRAYRAMTDPAEDTAPALQKLIDLGAVVVGKTRTTQFALGERPTADYVDQLAPFNPRGDGYQHPQGSSCGTGAGVASYEWLDFGTGSDTGGSVRLPAQANGLFGMRITNASLPLTGILPLSPIFDTPGLLSRSARLLQIAYNAWFESKPYTSYPKRIVLPEEFWPTVNMTSMPIFTSFIEKLATFLDADVQSINTNSSFNAFSNTTGGISEYLGLTYSNITNYDQWRLLAVPFKTEYQAKFGKAPYWNPVTRARWTRGASLPLSSYNSAIDHCTVFQNWFRSTLTPSCESGLVLYPMSAGTEDYRDTYISAPSAIFGAGYPGTQMSVLAALPDYTVPIGERTYYSRVTERNETLPVTVGIIAAAGCDGMLMDLVANLADSGVLVGEVKTGISMYT